MDNSKSGCFILLVVIAAIVLLSIHTKHKRDKIRENFTQVIPNLLASAEQAQEPSETVFEKWDSLGILNYIEKSSPVVTRGTKGVRQIGKIVVLDETNKCLDDIYFRLPKKSRAVRPEEINFLITTVWLEETIGYYTHSNSSLHVPAIQHSCGLNIIDYQTQEILLADTVFGSKPPLSTQEIHEKHGSVPHKKVVRIIRRFCM